MQIDNAFLDQITQGVLGVVDKFGETRAEGIRKIREAVQEAVEHFDIVTREEFDVTTRLLSNTRVKVDELERKVAILEGRLTELTGVAPPDGSEEDDAP